MVDYSKFYYDQIKSQVININKQYPEDEISTSFLRLCCSTILDLEYEDVDDDITDEGEDLGADAVHFAIDEDKTRFKIFVIQTKFNSKKCDNGIFNVNMGEEVVNKFKNVFDYFASSDTGDNVSDKVKYKKEEYQSLLQEGYILDEIYFVSCHLGIGLADNSLEIWNRWYNMNPYKEKIRLEQYGLVDIFKRLEESRVSKIDEKISLNGKYFEFSNPDVKGLISSIKGEELIRLYGKYGNKLFQKNIRFSLGENIINSKIIKSASEAETRDKFWFLNNGITVVCDNYERTGTQPENIMLEVKSFSIVNGVQTTTSIEKAFKKTGNIDDVKILIKIFKAPDKLAELITESTNSQNPVNKRDLRSNDDVQKLIENMLKDNGYFYQRKRNQWIEISQKDKIIDNYDFAQRYLTFYLERPMDAQKQKSLVFTDDDTYKKIFNPNLSPESMIFIHKSYKELLKQLRVVRRKLRMKQIRLSKEEISIIPRVKIHLFYAFRVYLEKKGFNILSDSDLSENALKEFNQENTVLLLNIIVEAIKKVYGSKPLEYVNVFKKKELAQKIREVIEKMQINKEASSKS
ncbi:AIPR family protein [Candidatus Woesearchaeota archaeon]|nr:AIPR family protein [Candidatus Woesearchaeota archaeon]